MHATVPVGTIIYVDIIINNNIYNHFARSRTETAQKTNYIGVLRTFLELLIIRSIIFVKKFVRCLTNILKIN